jgi:hypothetical protein
VIQAYFDTLRGIVLASPLVQVFSLQTDQRSTEIGFLRGDLTLIDGTRLHFREYIRQVEGEMPDRYMYAYQYQRADGTLIFRYDNSDHHPDLPNAPHHKHERDEACSCARSGGRHARDRGDDCDRVSVPLCPDVTWLEVPTR